MAHQRVDPKEMYKPIPVHFLVLYVSGVHRAGQSQGGLWQRMSGSKAGGSRGAQAAATGMTIPSETRVMTTPASAVPSRVEEWKMVMVETQF